MRIILICLLLTPSLSFSTCLGFLAPANDNIHVSANRGQRQQTLMRELRILGIENQQNNVTYLTPESFLQQSAINRDAFLNWLKNHFASAKVRLNKALAKRIDNHLNKMDFFYIRRQPAEQIFLHDIPKDADHKTFHNQLVEDNYSIAFELVFANRELGPIIRKGKQGLLAGVSLNQKVAEEQGYVLPVANGILDLEAFASRTYGPQPALENLARRFPGGLFQVTDWNTHEQRAFWEQLYEWGKFNDAPIEVLRLMRLNYKDWVFTTNDISVPLRYLIRFALMKEATNDPREMTKKLNTWDIDPSFAQDFITEKVLHSLYDGGYATGFSLRLPLGVSNEDLKPIYASLLPKKAPVTDSRRLDPNLNAN